MRERRLSNLTIYDSLKSPESNRQKYHRGDSTTSTNSQRESNRPSSRRRRSSVTRNPLVDVMEKKERENLNMDRFSSRVMALKRCEIWVARGAKDEHRSVLTSS